MSVLKDRIQRVAQRTLYLSTNADESQSKIKRWTSWDWSIGVGFYGVWKAFEQTGNTSYKKSMGQWIDERVDKVDTICVNTNAPLLTVLRLMDSDTNQRYNDICLKFDSYVMKEAPRVPCGAIAHTVIGKEYTGEVWADTLFMSVLYLLQRGKCLGRKDYVQQSLEQLELHTRCLVDEKDGLFHHGWDDVVKEPKGVKWGRGNAWITVSIIEMLELLEKEDNQEIVKIVLQRIHKQLDTLQDMQDRSGLWHTVLDKEDTYLETSVTAGIAYGVLKGIRLGLLDNKYENMAWKAVEALIEMVDEEGNVIGGSTGTPIKANANEYNNIACAVTPFTQGLALMALSEAYTNKPDMILK